MQYGFRFRFVDPDNYYSFGIINEYGVLASRQDHGVWERLFFANGMFKGDPYSFQIDKINRLKLNVEGSHFRFFVNDQLVGEAFDDKLDSGRVGLYVNLHQPGDLAVVEFDNFELKLLPEETVENVVFNGPYAYEHERHYFLHKDGTSHAEIYTIAHINGSIRIRPPG